MRQLRDFCFIVVLGLSSLPVMAQANSPAVLKPGEWEITIHTVAPVDTPPTVTRACIGKDEERLQPPKGKPTDDCQVVSGGGLTGNVLQYAMKCGKKNSSSTAKFTFNANSFEGVVTVQIDGTEIRQVHTGTRIGDCDPATAVP
jgi:hypothetical protein